MITLDSLRANRDRILEIAERHGASNIRVFGSIARGEAGPESDVDLLVDFEPGRGLLDHAALVLDLEWLLNRRVEIGTTRGLKVRYRDRVLGEAIVL